MRRALDKILAKRDQLTGVGLALQQIFEEDTSADAAMARMIDKLDSWDNRSENGGKAA